MVGRDVPLAYAQQAFLRAHHLSGCLSVSEIRRLLVSSVVHESRFLSVAADSPSATLTFLTFNASLKGRLCSSLLPGEAQSRA